jgi:hypothetical protein
MTDRELAEDNESGDTGMRVALGFSWRCRYVCSCSGGGVVTVVVGV